MPLPFTGVECPSCGSLGHFVPRESDDPCPGDTDLPWDLDRAVTVFLHRWCFNWRGEQATLERELRELIADARKVG